MNVIDILILSGLLLTSADPLPIWYMLRWRHARPMDLGRIDVGNPERRRYLIQQERNR